MEYLFYIDESGDPSLTSINPDFPVFVLAGCLFEASAYLELCSKIQDLKKEFFETEFVVLHSRDIRKCQGAFTKLFDSKFKTNFYNKLNSIIKNSNYTVISVAIDKKPFMDKYGKKNEDPYGLALSFQLERVSWR